MLLVYGHCTVIISVRASSLGTIRPHQILTNKDGLHAERVEEPIILDCLQLYTCFRHVGALVMPQCVAAAAMFVSVI